MSLCFLLGSKRYANKHAHPLKVRHYIEYLTYDLERNLIHITGDFLVENHTSSPHSLVFLHRGNIQFENVTDEWCKDEHWTAVLLNAAKSEIGLDLDKKEKRLYLCELDAGPTEVHFLKNPLVQWGQKQPSGNNYVPFSAYEYSDIKPGTLSLLRVSGNLEGDSYDTLLPGGFSNRRFTICGGLPLLKIIEQELDEQSGSGHSMDFRKFTSMYWEDPAYYHVLFESSRGQKFKTLTTSSDMTRVYLNKSISNGRVVNWFWSDSDFNVHTLANGPRVELVSV